MVRAASSNRSGVATSRLGQALAQRWKEQRVSEHSPAEPRHSEHFLHFLLLRLHQQALPCVRCVYAVHEQRKSPGMQCSGARVHDTLVAGPYYSLQRQHHETRGKLLVIHSQFLVTHTETGLRICLACQDVAVSAVEKEHDEG